MYTEQMAPFTWFERCESTEQDSVSWFNCEGLENEITGGPKSVMSTVSKEKQ